MRTVLDLPCGTGRFTGPLVGRGYRVVGADISYEMIRLAQRKKSSYPPPRGYVQAEAERLPFADRSFDCVVSVRFMVDVNLKVRLRILREMRRVSRRWIIVDYRHRRSYRYWLWRLRKMLGLKAEPLLNRVNRRELEFEFRSAGLSILKVIPVATFFSDKWVVLAEAPSAARLR